MFNNMNKLISLISFLGFILLFSTACTTSPIANTDVERPKKPNTLLVYEDGRMEFNSRFIDEKDVVIYADGRGGERAAIKVRVPIHPDFYRDSIIVVRVEHQFDEAITKRETEEVNNIN